MLKRMLALLVAGTMLFAACGGGDDDGGDGGGGTETGTDGGTETGTDGDGDIGVIDSAQCAEVAAAMAAAAQAIPAAFTGSASDLEASIQQMQAFADAAPDEISADLQTIYAAYAEFAAALADADFDPASGQAPPPEVIAALEEASAALDTEEVQAAVARVNAYFEGGCEG
jgi:hypothetical protein